MHTPAKRILAHHQKTLLGCLKLKRLQSRALGIAKPFYVYEPPNFNGSESLPVLYLFRGHEREWVNLREDQSRIKSTAIEDIDHLICDGILPQLLIVLPGLNSYNNWIPSLGIDMAGHWERKFRGLGTGRFWTYFTEELIPFIEHSYPQTQAGAKMMAGFSLGGYTVSLLSAKLPGYFDHAAIYDGTFMWPNHSDPRIGRQRCNDRIWCNSPLFDAALGRPRDKAALHEWNATSIIQNANAGLLKKLRKTTFWVASAAKDGGFGNRDRAHEFAKILHEHDMMNGFKNIIFDTDAAHTWHWVDRFLVTFLMLALMEEAREIVAWTEYGD
ncbi:MAG: alpha/beta hydrolase [bacterium]